MNGEATLAKLLEGWLDGGLSDAEQADLLRQLGADPELRRRFARQVVLLGATRAAADANPRWLALFDLLDHGDDPAGQVLSFEEATMGRIESVQRLKWRARTTVWSLAAAVALLATAVFLLWPKDSRPADPALAGGRPASQAPVPAPRAPSPVAVVVDAAAEAGFEAGAYLRPGIVSRDSGWVTLQTLRGVAVTLDAPFAASLVDLDRIRLNQGRARVRVPAGAEGFRLESPAFDVVDLGTEFAAKVNGDGTGTCRVFEGEADVSLLDSVGEVKRTLRLAASKSVQISPSEEALRLIEEADTDYPPIKQPPRALLRLAPSYAAEVLRLEPAAYWRFEAIDNGNVAGEIPVRARLKAVGTAAIAGEAGGNHSGELTRWDEAGFFVIVGAPGTLLEGDFTIGFFVQLSWLQNFAMVSAMRYDESAQGHSFILQSYASLSKIGIEGSALHSVFRDPPAWDGGKELFGAARLRPLHWHHVVVTRKDGVATLFLDGAAIARQPVGSMPLDCREIFLGRLNGNARQPRREAREMVGHIDELVIFRRTLREEEIVRLGSHLPDPE